jgi:translation initiation factor IF-1
VCTAPAPTSSRRPTPMPETPLHTIATIVAALGPRAFHATLPNGKPVVAHLPAHAAPTQPPAPGDRVRVALSPYDLDHARIEGPADPPGAACT